MTTKIKIDDKEYDSDNLTEKGKVHLNYLQFTTARLEELTNMQALLQCAKNSYIDNLKKEMLSEKSGFLFGDE